MSPLQILALAIQIDPGALVTINVQGDSFYTLPHTIRISAQQPGRPRSAEERDGRSWVAIRTSDRGSQSVTSTDCPALRSVAATFGDLPAVTINPPPLAVATDDTIQYPPTIKDGFATSLSFRTLTEDGSSAEVTITYGNAYQQWGHDAVSSLIPCWGPLTP